MTASLQSNTLPTFSAEEVVHVQNQVRGCAIVMLEPGELPGTVLTIICRIGTDSITLTKDEDGFVQSEYEAHALWVTWFGSPCQLESALAQAVADGRKVYAIEGRRWPWGD